MPFKEEPTFSNIEISKLEHPALLKYLADRGIPKEIAQRYCVQVDYEPVSYTHLDVYKRQGI